MNEDETDAAIERFLSLSPIAVVGASNDPAKYGYRVFAACRAYGIAAYPVNAREKEVQGVPAFASIAALPEPVKALSVITPPAVTERVVEEADPLGVEIVWMQPGAESEQAITRAEEMGMTVIHGGPCILVELALRRRKV